MYLHERFNVTESQAWTFFGSYDQKAKTSIFGLVLAVIVALETFTSHDSKYSITTSIVIVSSGLFLGKKAREAGSIFGVLTAAFSFIWLIPLFDSQFFYSFDSIFMAAHLILTLAVVGAAFTYLKK